jgi:hypothetical protein
METPKKPHVYPAFIRRLHELQILYSAHPGDEECGLCIIAAEVGESITGKPAEDIIYHEEHCRYCPHVTAPTIPPEEFTPAERERAVTRACTVFNSVLNSRTYKDNSLMYVSFPEARNTADERTAPIRKAHAERVGWWLELARKAEEVTP